MLDAWEETRDKAGLQINLEKKLGITTIVGKDGRIYRLRQFGMRKEDLVRRVDQIESCLIGSELEVEGDIEKLQAKLLRRVQVCFSSYIIFDRTLWII